MCSLMTVPDSREWKNTQNVRMFGSFSQLLFLCLFDASFDVPKHYVTYIK